MAAIMLVLLIIGWVVAVVGGIMLLVVAFKESVLWGLGCLLVPFVALIFLIMHWSQAKNAFFVQLAGMALIFIALVAGAMLGVHHVPQQ